MTPRIKARHSYRGARERRLEKTGSIAWAFTRTATRSNYDSDTMLAFTLVHADAMHHLLTPTPSPSTKEP